VNKIPTVLFVHYGDAWIRGSERVLLDLMSGLDSRRFRPILQCNTETLANEAKKLNIQTYIEPMSYFFTENSPTFSPVKLISQANSIRHLIHAEGVDLIHVNGAAPCQWVAPVARFKRIPFLCHLHAPYLKRARYTSLLHMADTIVGVSSYVLEGLREDGVKKDVLSIIPNGIDRTRFGRLSNKGIRHEIGVSQNVFLIVSVGSLINRKGHDRLIQAVKLLPSSLDAHLAIIGDGPDKSYLENLIHQENLSSRVHLLPHRDTMTCVYSEADIFALASRQEAFGLVLAEAGYHSLPSVATNQGGIPDVIVDGVTGILVENIETEICKNIALAIEDLASNPEKRQTLGRAARTRVLEQFLSERMILSFQERYNSILSNVKHGFSFAPYTKLICRKSRTR
jgi:L-malate glycosyltransferase